MAERESESLSQDEATLKEMLVEIGARIRRIRIENGLKQKDLAALAEIRAGTVTAVEYGLQNITLRTLLKFADVLNTPLGALIPTPLEPTISDAAVARLDGVVEAMLESLEPLLLEQEKRGRSTTSLLEEIRRFRQEGHLGKLGSHRPGIEPYGEVEGDQ